MYPAARDLNEGWVRNRKRDEFGYPAIYVEWDRDHWAYSGEEDGWTMEAHFDKVEESMQNEEGNLPAPDEPIFQALIKAIKEELQKDNEDNIDKTQGEPESVEDRSEYEAAVEEAMQAAHDGIGFVIVVANSMAIDKDEVIVPTVLSYSTRPDAEALLEAQLSDLGAQAHYRSVIRRLKSGEFDEYRS